MSHENPIVIKEEDNDEEKEEEDGEVEDEGDAAAEPPAKKAKAVQQTPKKPPPQQHQVAATFPALQDIFQKYTKPAIQYNATGQPIFMLPRDGKVLLLDIEGTTTSITFVKDVLFPYISNNVAKYLQDKIAASNNPHSTIQELKQLNLGLQADVKEHGLESDYRQHQVKTTVKKEDEDPNAAVSEHQWLLDSITSLVKFLVEKDVKGKQLKAFQGQMWKCGYEQGKLHGHVYDDVLPTFQWMAQQGVPVYIYSSGSIQAQKNLFEYSTCGNLLHFLGGHYDMTNAGNKREVTSYEIIAKEFKARSRHTDARDIIFVSDIEQEVQAAVRAGMQGVLSIRPGNAPCSEEALKQFAQVHSLLQLCGGEKRQWFQTPSFLG